MLNSLSLVIREDQEDNFIFLNQTVFKDVASLTIVMENPNPELITNNLANYNISSLKLLTIHDLDLEPSHLRKIK